MVWNKFFKKKKKPEEAEIDPLSDLTLSKLKVGYLVDYDMQTWEVTGYAHYDWGGGDLSWEWQLKSAGDTLYLEREADDEDYWCVSRKIAFSRLGDAVRDHIRENDDPPDEIVFEGTTYYLEESGGARYCKDGKRPGQEMLKWEYEDDEGESFLTIEQWGENSFEAALGFQVEEYQFSNILPGA